MVVKATNKRKKMQRRQVQLQINQARVDENELVQCKRHILLCNLVIGAMIGFALKLLFPRAFDWDCLLFKYLRASSLGILIVRVISLV